MTLPAKSRTRREERKGEKSQTTTTQGILSPVATWSFLELPGRSPPPSLARNQLSRQASREEVPFPPSPRPRDRKEGPPLEVSPVPKANRHPAGVTGVAGALLIYSRQINLPAFLTRWWTNKGVWIYSLHLSSSHNQTNVVMVLERVRWVDLHLGIFQV